MGFSGLSSSLNCLKIFCLTIVFFILGLGKIEDLGLAMLGSSGNGSSNTVIIDLRLIAFLATVIVILMIVHSVLDIMKVNNLV